MDIILGVALFILFFLGMVGFITVGWIVTKNFRLPEKFNDRKNSLLIKLVMAIVSRVTYSSFFYAPTAVIVMLFYGLTLAFCSDIEKGLCLLLATQIDKVFQFSGNLVNFTPKSFISIILLIIIPHLLKEGIKKLK